MSQNIPLNRQSKPTLPRPITPGVYVPTPAIFHDDKDESLDYATTTQHSVRLARAGVTGICLHGSNGEAVHLTSTERRDLLLATRDALTAAGFEHIPLLVGASAQSTQATIELCNMAKDGGADAVLVLPPSYYKTLFDGDEATMVRFYVEVAEACRPMAVVVYNFPGGANGVDLSSDVLVALARQCENIVGVKFTCGNTGKLGRVAAATADTKQFLCFAGSGDFLLPALAVGGAGVIGGIANLCPRAVVRMYEAAAAGRREEAERIQRVVARADWIAIQWGVIGIKTGLQAWEGYGGWARRPLPRVEGEARRQIEEGFREVMELERELAKAASSG